MIFFVYDLLNEIMDEELQGEIIGGLNTIDMKEPPFTSGGRCKVM